jgi:hypothetical protein
VHFLDLASAVEKLRWAEKEWRELDRELGTASGAPTGADSGGEGDESDDEEEADEAPKGLAEPVGARPRAG